jgi:lysozyme
MKQTKTSNVGIDLIKHFESLHDGDLSRVGIQPKLCPANIYTTGWGHAIVDPKTNKFIKADTPNGYERASELFKDLTLKEADDLLLKDLIKYENIVKSRIKVQLKQHEFDALVSHTFNTGGSTTLFKLINAEPLTSERIRIWWTTKYITAGGKPLNGLVRRRKVEYDLFSKGNLKLT